MGCLNAKITLDTSTKVSATISLVCDVLYLRAPTSDILWVVPKISTKIPIESNTKWIIHESLN